ncbi:hypothetical protein ACOSP7_030576 [Xanthoceras sorbifolium]
MTSTKEEILNFPVEIEEGKEISIQVKLRTSKKRSIVYIMISTPKAKKNKRNQSSDPEHQENESRYATIKTSTRNALPVEFLQALLKMAPTPDEELKLRLFTVVVDIPFVYKRVESLLFMCTLQEEVTFTKGSFEILEVLDWMKETGRNLVFLNLTWINLLEAVLKTDNRINDGTFHGGAQAFKLDTLLKLADVKGVAGKPHYCILLFRRIIRSEGVRAAHAMRESQSFSGVRTEELLKEVSHDTEDHYRHHGLQVVSRLSIELENVKKATYFKSLEEESGFHETLKSFVQNAEVDIKWLPAAKTMKKESSTASSSDTRQQPSLDPPQKLFPAIAERQMDDSSSEGTAFLEL